MAQWISVLADILYQHSTNGEFDITTVAAQIAAHMASQEGANLLPGDSPWLADMTVRVACVQGMLSVSCKKKHLSLLQEPQIEPVFDPLTSLDGFHGSAPEFMELVSSIHWGCLE